MTKQDYIAAINTLSNLKVCPSIYNFTYTATSKNKKWAVFAKVINYSPERIEVDKFLLADDEGDMYDKLLYIIVNTIDSSSVAYHTCIGHTSIRITITHKNTIISIYTKYI